MNVSVITSDSKVWNIEEVYSKITEAMVTDQDIKIDLNNEGPDISATVLEKYIMYCANIYNYDPSDIVDLHTNALNTQSDLPMNVLDPDQSKFFKHHYRSN